MFQKSMMVLVLIAVSVIGGTIYGIVTSDEVNLIDAATTSNNDKAVSQSEEQKIFVYVTGAVNKPGMIELNSNGEAIRAAEAINACGGFLPTADIDNFNIAQTISDGQHIRVPEKDIDKNAQVNSTSNKFGSKSKSEGSIVDINNADIEELKTLSGIGVAMAQRIIEYRDSHGAFKSIDEIKNVRGIGEKKFEKIKDRIKI